MKMNLLLALVSGLSISAASYAKTCDVTIEGTDAMQYNTKEIKLAGCTEVKLTLKHVGKLPKAAMGHNIVISTKADMSSVVADATKSGPSKDYQPAGSKVIANTKLVGGGESDTITFKTDKFKKGTDYVFFCTFPGHSAVMNGKVSL